MPILTITLSDAESYFANRLYTSVWDSASSADRQKAVGWASKIIEGAFDFCSDAYEIDDNVVVWHPQVISAVCEQVIWCLSIDPTKYPELLTMGIAEGNAGASAKFDKSFVAPLVCEAAKTLIGSLGVFNSDSGTIKSYFLGG